MDIFKLRTFYHVAKLGSLTEASKHLNYSIPNVSRQLTSLEEGLNVKLFHRKKNKLTLTLQGEMLFQKATHILNEIDGIKNLLMDNNTVAAGLLRVSTLHSIASAWLSSYLKGFSDQYPNMRLAITAEDTMADVFLKEAEVAIGPAVPDHPDLMQTHLVTTYWKLYASPEYLQQFGTPLSLKELDHHRLIVRTEVGNLPYKVVNWLLSAEIGDNPPREPCLRINSLVAMADIAADGLGIVALPDIMKDLRDLNLIQILPEIDGPTLEVTYIYPKALKNSKRITCLRDYLVERIAKEHSPLV